MRIAVLTNAYPPSHDGGAARIAEILVELWRDKGHVVRVWCPEIRWFSASSVARLFYHLRDFRPRREFVNEIVEWKPEILVTHNLTGCGFGTPKRIVSHGVRWVHVLHDGQLFEPSGTIYHERVTGWQCAWTVIRRRFFGCPYLIVVPTKWIFEIHRKHGWFLSTPFANVQNPGPPIETVERHVHDPIRLLFVGRISREKGSNVLRNIVPELAAKSYQLKAFSFHLTLLGEGPEKQIFQDMSNVTCLGQLDSGAIRARMLEADMLLVPSQIRENQPTVILEAASVGLPVIASRLGGIVETLQGAGFCCHPTRTQEWMDAIHALLQPQTYLDQCQRMHALAKEHERTKVSREWENLFA